jgi:alkylhydroperoxidase/carboxymuconolactone decarboxylase family protein YurZ
LNYRFEKSGTLGCLFEPEAAILAAHRRPTMPENPLKTVLKVDPELVERMRREEDWAFADGALSRKMKLLIAVAYDAAHGAVAGVRSLAQDAIKAGATKEEIGEALRVAYLLSGIGSVYVGSQGLAELLS